MKKTLERLIIKKSWGRKNSQIEPNDNKWIATKKDNVAEEVVQLLIDELKNNYELEEKENDNK